MQAFDTPEDQETAGEAPAGKMSLPTFSGMRGQQEKSRMLQHNGMAAPTPAHNGVAAPTPAHNDSARLDTVV